MSTLNIKVKDSSFNTEGEINIPIENVLQFVSEAAQKELRNTITAMTVNAAELRAPDIEDYIERLQKLQRDARLAQDVLTRDADYTARVNQ